MLYCTILCCTDLYLPAGVDLVSAALPAAGPVTVLLALPVPATCGAARAPHELMMQTGDGGVQHQGHQEAEGGGAEHKY